MKYTITFQSHNYHAGGTKDSKVFVQFLGTHGGITWYPSALIHVNGQDKEPNRIFEKVNKQTFEVEGDDVGEVLHMRVIHDNKVGLCMWHLAWVLLVTDKQRTTFEADKWLDRGAVGSELMIDLSPKRKNVVDEDRSVDCNTRYGQALRCIESEKNKMDKDSEAYKVLVKAEEIMASKEFAEKIKGSRAYLQSIGILDEETFHERMEEQAIDMAEREFERTHEFMQYERAGLPAGEQEAIPKLDETTNLCYKYLRDHGNNWQYDPEKIDPRMKGRLYRRFDTFDKDSDGIMTIAEVLTWADRMKSVCNNTTEQEIQKVRNALEYYFTMYGLGGKGLHRENWVEAHVAMGAAAEERKKHGDPVPMEVLANAYFDVIDENDDGVLDLPELKKMMNVFRVPEEAAYPFFEMADEDNSGLLERKEMHQLFYKFWFGAGYCELDTSLDHIFAYKY